MANLAGNGIVAVPSSCTSHLGSQCLYMRWSRSRCHSKHNWSGTLAYQHCLIRWSQVVCEKHWQAVSVHPTLQSVGYRSNHSFKTDLVLTLLDDRFSNNSRGAIAAASADVSGTSPRLFLFYICDCFYGHIIPKK